MRAIRPIHTHTNSKPPLPFLKVITALGGVWHPEHFACAYCQANVVNDFFYEHDGAPYCTECHLSVFAPKCAFCGEAITDVSAFIGFGGSVRSLVQLPNAPKSPLAHFGGLLTSTNCSRVFLEVRFLIHGFQITCAALQQ